MGKLLEKFTPADCIAVITITGGLGLKFAGFDGTVSFLLTTIVVSYFGKRAIYDVIQSHKNNF